MEECGEVYDLFSIDVGSIKFRQMFILIDALIRAPELAVGFGSIHFALDIWAAGVTMAEMSRFLTFFSLYV